MLGTFNNDEYPYIINYIFCKDSIKEGDYKKK